MFLLFISGCGKIPKQPLRVLNNLKTCFLEENQAVLDSVKVIRIPQPRV